HLKRWRQPQRRRGSAGCERRMRSVCQTSGRFPADRVISETGSEERRPPRRVLPGADILAKTLGDGNQNPGFLVGTSHSWPEKAWRGEGHNCAGQQFPACPHITHIFYLTLFGISGTLRGWLRPNAGATAFF